MDDKKEKRKTDWLLITAYLLSSIIGLLMIYSASSYRLMTTGGLSAALLQRQLVFLLLSWGMIVFIQRMRVQVLLSRKLAWTLLSFGVVMLFLTHFSILGVTVNGAQRWISIFGIQFQPSEITNVGMILYLASYFKEKRALPELKKPLMLLFLCCLLILLQPKVAGVIILVFLAFIMIATVQVPVKMIMLMFGVLVGSLFLFGGTIFFLGQQGYLPEFFMHVYYRIQLVGNPFSDPYGQGFQMVHSYYALYNGGLSGLGLGNSITKKGFLPVAETDFIFSVLVEELGLFMGIFVIGLLFVIILRLFIRAAAVKDSQSGLILLGTATLLLLQTSINIASILGLMPMTGVPLPFISYGGSSYLILSFALGICLKLERGVSEIVQKA